mmetsp:Transcript_49700/g.118293  ORF Transcript_49700/g.118293 Transcript_49700/m.118293 type:complete len:232 (-) Transcript_49700:269-964(-)
MMPRREAPQRLTLFCRNLSRSMRASISSFGCAIPIALNPLSSAAWIASTRSSSAFMTWFSASSIRAFFSRAGCRAARSAPFSASPPAWMANWRRSRAALCRAFCSRIRAFIRSGCGGAPSRDRAWHVSAFLLHPTSLRHFTPQSSNQNPSLPCGGSAMVYSRASPCGTNTTIKSPRGVNPESSHSTSGAPPRKTGASHAKVMDEVSLETTRKLSGTSGTAQKVVAWHSRRQ